MERRMKGGKDREWSTLEKKDRKRKTLEDKRMQREIEIVFFPECSRANKFPLSLVHFTTAMHCKIYCNG
jgi:hypothetical protein